MNNTYLTPGKQSNIPSENKMGAVEIEDASSGMRANVKEVSSAGSTTTDGLVTQNLDQGGVVVGDNALPEAKYRSPMDFTVTYTSASTITLTGLPFTIATGMQVRYILIRNSSTNITTRYIHGVNGYAFANSSGVITAYKNGSVASIFTSNDMYSVGLDEQDKGWDAGLSLIKVGEQSPNWTRVIDKQSLISASQDFTASFVDCGPEVYALGYSKVLFFATVDINDSLDPRFKVLAKHTGAGTEEYPLSDAKVKVHTDSTYVAAAASRYFELNDNADQLVVVEVDTTGGISWLQLQITAGTVGATAGQIDALYASASYQ
jgi:hypothetical protein